MSQASAASAGTSETRVAELISMQLGEFSTSFAATAQASFDNIRTFIDDRFMQERQLEPNPSVSDSSPVPVDLGPRQAQTDPSVRNPCIAFGAGGQAQDVSATSSFLASLRAPGIAVPQGVVIGDRSDRVVSPATVHGAPAVAVQHEQPEEPLRGGRPPLAAAAHPAPARQGQDAQPQSILRTSREPLAQGVMPGPALGESPHKIAFREVNFAERVREFAEEDEALSSTEKVAASEGRRSVLRLLYQLCPGAAPKSQPAILRASTLLRTLLRLRRDRPPSFTGSQSCARSIKLTSVRLRRWASQWPLPSLLAAGIEVAAPSRRLSPQLP